MRDKWTQFRLITVFCTLFILFSCCENNNSEELINLLIISGKNNHNWSKTTPLLIKTFKETRLFNINVTENPDTLTYEMLRRYDAIISNWNTWPENNTRMTAEWEKDFLRYVTEGGGAVFIHAGASSFYTWDEYHRIGIGRWGKETRHGKAARGKVYGFNQSHPITKGIRDFYIVDELWENTEINPDAIALASLSAVDETDRHQICQKAVFVNQTGEGKSFYTILGHDERALLNTGLQTLLIRGTIWAAGRKINIDLPSGLKEPGNSSDTLMRWHQSDSAIGLKRGRDIIWQYNFNNRYRKQYFHPVTAANSTLTCVSPPDHPWHMGIWFSWKFINGINYWEYLDNYKSDETGYKSAGTTSIQKIEFAKKSDFSADINIDLLYQPIEGKPVMMEKTKMHISAPLPDRSYFIDFNHLFSPTAGELVLDRTPIEGEPGGRSWGGYAGLSVRFSQDYTSPVIIAPTESEKYKKNNWVYMGFNTLTGDTAGICIFNNPEFTTVQTSWYVINKPEIPFYYYSPAAVFDGKIVLRKGEQLQLKYRVWIIPGNTGAEELNAKYSSYLNNITGTTED